MPEDKMKDIETNTDLVERENYNLDESRVEAISGELQIENRQHLYEYGSKLQDELSKVSNQVLDESRNFDTQNMQKTLDSLLEKFDDANPEVLTQENDSKLKQWWMKLTDSFKKQLGLLETASAEIDKMAEQLRENKEDLLNDAKRLELMNETSKHLYDELAYYIAGATYKLEELETKTLPALQQNVQDNDPKAAQDIQDVTEFKEAVEQRRYDLELTQSVILQSRMELRAMTGINYHLANQLNSSIMNLVPQWRMNFAKAISMAKARSGYIAMEKVREGTNKMMQQNAENLSRNIVETAKQGNQPMVDIDKLKEGRNQIMRAIEDSQRITAESKAKQEKDREAFKQFKDETMAMLESANRQLGDDSDVK